MEFLLVLIVVLLSAGGLALGVLLGRGPLRGSCGGMACMKDVSCDGCPHRRQPDRT